MERSPEERSTCRSVPLAGDKNLNAGEPEKKDVADPSCEALGTAIAARRKARGMTQRELAEITGIDQAAISRIESGKTNPTIGTLTTLAEGIGATLIVSIN